MPQSPFYSSAKWRATRENYLRLHPHCGVCTKLGLISKAIEVDHIIRLGLGGAPFDHKNLQGMCKTHHSQKTIMIDGQHSGSGKLLVTTGVDGWPVDIEKPRSIVRAPKRFT